jgi:phenylacetate-CoA ligase
VNQLKFRFGKDAPRKGAFSGLTDPAAGAVEIVVTGGGHYKIGRLSGMAVRFRVRDFLLPTALLRYRALFDRAQWWPPDRMRAYQATRLRALLRHAIATVPRYRDAFSTAAVRVDDVRGIEDLGWLPRLTKDDISTSAAALTASNARRFRPAWTRTTGSTAMPVAVLIDRQLNALEFAFYWRHWGWFGYRLGTPFAQLSWSEFAGRESEVVRFEPGTRRLLLNACYLSAERADAYASAMREHRVRYLKGHPSALLHLALFIRSSGRSRPAVRAVFSTGEVCEPSVRAVIAEVFQAPVADAYGQMERVVAACECPRGRMHLNTDYGACELVDERRVGSTTLAGVVATGLHNMSMPLVRYETGDLVEALPAEGGCPCGRTLPLIGRVYGRSVDAILTPDGRAVTVASIVFNDAVRVLQGQLVQSDLDGVLVRVLPAAGFSVQDERRLVEAVRKLAGSVLNVRVEAVSSPADFIVSRAGKHRPVVSYVDRARVDGALP